MDKSWMKTQITSQTFKDGVESFINFARVKAIRGSIVCPCLKCCNDKWLDADIAHVHILRYGFLPGYTTWTFHGEKCTPLPLPQVTSEMFHEGDNMERLVRDAFGVTSSPLNNQELRDYEVEGNIGVEKIAETDGVNPHSQQCHNTGENQCDNSGENNENENARKDLMEKGIRHELHLIEQPNKKAYLPPACYTMSNVEKKNFLQVLKDLKVPDGYASNISRGVSLKDCRISNLKSHDAHILMQDILPIALRVSMTSRAQSRVVKAVNDFCLFFKGLCVKVLDVSDLEKMESQIVKTLCELEQLFPPSFFTVMVHLTIHLISEAKLGGPVHYRWMYPVERYLMRLKSYVRNKAQPEGSIAEGYIKDECITFCSRYFEGVDTPFNRPPRNNESTSTSDLYILNSGGRKLGKVESVELDSKSLAQAHRYVLLNHPKIQPFRDRFLDEKQALRNQRMDMKTMETLIVEEFPCWLQQQAALLGKIISDEEVLSLAVGPSTRVKMCKGFITNGFRFLTKRREEIRKTQNSGVVVQVEEGNYYGKLTEIIEMEYSCKIKVVLFRCDWVDIRPSRGLKKDKYGFPVVNFSKPLVHTGEALKDDPFIISSQARQVFYIEDVKDVGWSHVVMTKPRDTYDMGSNVNTNDEDEVYTQCIPSDLPVLDDVSEPPRLRRIDNEIDDE